MKALEISISLTEYLAMPAMLADDMVILREGEGERLQKLMKA